MAKVLVFGATGVAGQFIIDALVAAKSSFSSIGIFTSPSTIESKPEKIHSLKKNDVNVHVGDVGKEEDVLDAYKGYDTVVSAVGRNAILTQIELLRIAEQSSNIKRFFPSEYGTDIEYFPESAHEKPHQLKLKVRAYIDEHIKRLEYTYVVTGPYADLYIGNMKPERAHVGSFDARTKKAVLLGDGDGPVSFTTMHDLGRLVVASLLHPGPSRNRALKVNSFTATPRQILTEFEKQTGSKWDVSYTSIEELRSLEKEAWEKNDPMATVYTLRRIWTEGGTLYEKRDNALINADDTESLSTAVARAIERETSGSQSGKM